MHLSENLRILREQRGFSQAEMAGILNITPSAITMYECGNRTPKLPLLIQVAEYFNITLDDLVLKDLTPSTPCYAKNLRYLREKYGMTQEDMAKMLGYKGKQGYSEAEHGKTRLSVEQLLKLSEFFGVTLDQLVKTDLTGGDDDADSGRDPQVTQVLRAQSKRCRPMNC